MSIVKQLFDLTPFQSKGLQKIRADLQKPLKVET